MILQIMLLLTAASSFNAVQAQGESAKEIDVAGFVQFIVSRVDFESEIMLQEVYIDDSTMALRCTAIDSTEWAIIGIRRPESKFEVSLVGTLPVLNAGETTRRQKGIAKGLTVLLEERQPSLSTSRGTNEAWLIHVGENGREWRVHILRVPGYAGGHVTAIVAKRNMSVRISRGR